MSFIKSIFILSFSVFTSFTPAFSMFAPINLPSGAKYKCCTKDDLSNFIWNLKLKDIDSLKLTQENVLDVIQSFNDIYLDWLQSKQIWRNSIIPKIEIQKILNLDELVSNPILPYYTKLKLPRDYNVFVIGDIHGNSLTVYELFQEMLKNKIIDESLRLKDKSFVISLGDYTDRGKENLEVLFLLQIFALKNPGKVILQKGNHEEVAMNYQYKGCNLMTELENSKWKNNEAILTEIHRFYELLPVVTFLEIEGNKELLLLAHGGPEIRFDYQYVLKHEFEDGLKEPQFTFSLIEKDNNIDKSDLLDLWKAYREKQSSSKTAFVQDSKEFDDVFSYLLNFDDLHYGFLWNDIEYKDKDYLGMYSSSRGKRILEISFDFCKYLFAQKVNQYNGYRIGGIIRGHSHGLPKNYVTSKLYNKVVKSKLTLAEQETPACLCFMDSINPFFHLEKNYAYKKDFDFGVYTLISGSIGSNIVYPSTFLQAFVDSKTNRWCFESVYNVSCKEAELSKSKKKLKQKNKTKAKTKIKLKRKIIKDDTGPNKKKQKIDLFG